MSKRITFTPVDGLMEIIEELQRVEFCRDRAEAINRMIANTAKRWKAQQAQGGSSHA